jgi:hypothetical protein
VLTEHDAEWVTDRVGEDSEAGLALTLATRGAECEQFLLSLVAVTDANIEVQPTHEADFLRCESS